jgi:hypothetical protein
MLEISWVAERLAASQGGLTSMELLSSWMLCVAELSETEQTESLIFLEYTFVTLLCVSTDEEISYNL